MKTILITGAAGNLGGLLAEHLANCDVRLHLAIHRKDVSETLRNRSNVKVFKLDLARKETLHDALSGVDTVIHFAGVLFKANPEKFLPKTNTYYFRNLLEAIGEHSVKRVILASFPHVEGETNPQNPAKGTLNGAPISMHAKTRLEEERLLFDMESKMGYQAVSLRYGMVYGSGILMIDAARWFARHSLLGVWKKETIIHLISKDDYLAVSKNAILNDNVCGIYHVGDDGVQSLQTFLTDCCKVWKCGKPWKMPIWMIRTAASTFELCSKLFKVRSPLTQDFISIGMVSYYGDTSRMKAELLPELKYKTYKEGINTLIYKE